MGKLRLVVSISMLCPLMVGIAFAQTEVISGQDAPTVTIEGKGPWPIRSMWVWRDNPHDSAGKVPSNVTWLTVPKGTVLKAESEAGVSWVPSTSSFHTERRQFS